MAEWTLWSSIVARSPRHIIPPAEHKQKNTLGSSDQGHQKKATAQSQEITLRVTDEMDPLWRTLHYGINGLFKALHLFPQRLQALLLIVQVNSYSSCTRVGLKNADRVCRQSQTHRSIIAIKMAIETELQNPVLLPNHSLIQ